MLDRYNRIKKKGLFVAREHRAGGALYRLPPHVTAEGHLFILQLPVNCPCPTFSQEFGAFFKLSAFFRPL